MSSEQRQPAPPLKPLKPQYVRTPAAHRPRALPAASAGMAENTQENFLIASDVKRRLLLVHTLWGQLPA